MDQEGVDAGSPRRAERVAEDLTGLVEIDIAHHLEGAVEIAVADGGNDDIADPAMIDAGNLRCWLRIHRGGPWGCWRNSQVRSSVDRSQERVDAIEQQVGRLHRHIVPGANFDVAGAGDGLGYALRHRR